MGMADYIVQGGQHGNYNPYQLRLKKLGKECPDIQVSVLKFSGTEALSQIPRYEIEFTSATPDIPAHLLINCSAELLMYPDGEVWENLTPRVIPGIITQFCQCNTSADITRYVAVLEHRMVRMAQGRNSAVWLNESIISLTEKTFSNHLVDKLSFAFKLTTRYPLHDFMLQYEEPDYAHVARRLADAGVAFYRQYDEENNEDVIVLTDHPHGWVKGPALPYRHPSGTYDGGTESVWDMQVIRTAVPKSVVVNDDNYLDAQSDMKAQVNTDEDYRALWGEEYRWAEHYPQAGRAYEAQPGEGVWYAGIRRERHRSQLITFEGKTNAMSLRPGMIITTPGRDWPDAPDGLLIVSTTCNNVARDAAYFVTFTAIPWSIHHTWRPEALPWPTLSGTLPARVSSTTENDIYSHIDAQGRYRICFDPDRGEWQKGFESCWVRLAKPYAGDEYGFHWPLLDGSGVMVAFESGDLDRPYIAHVMHDSRYGDHVTQQNHKRNILLTPAKNTLLMDDWREHEFIHLSTPHSGNSELNLGYLVDRERNPRGTGAELRTDEHVAVRGGKGVFISADNQTQGQGQQLDIQQAKALLSSALVEMQSLSASAHHAQALAADIGRQQALLQQKIENFQQAVLLASAPHGVALVSGEDMQLAADDNLTLTAGKQLDIGAHNDFTVAAGKQISLYSRQGAKLFTSHNNIDIQAQGGDVTTWSTNDTHISSGKKLIVTAQDELTLVCGGGYIKIKGGNVEIGGPGKLLIKNAGIAKQGPASMQGVMKNYAPESFDEKFVLLHPISGEPLSNQPFRIRLSDGTVKEGVTDAMGKTPLLQEQSPDKIFFELITGRAE